MHNFEYPNLNNTNITSKKFINGEKVICIANHYEKTESGEVDTEKSIFNGDSGRFLKYAQGQKIEMNTSRKSSVVIPYDSVEYGYAITVHKSQGSEYEDVLIVLNDSHGIMLNKQILYTAVTRAKKNLYIIGTMHCLDKCISTQCDERFDILADLISDGFDVSFE